MLKRVVVLSKNESLQKTLREKAKKADVQIVAADPGVAAPPATAGVVADADMAAAALALMAGLGNRNEDLLYLLADAIACREGIAQGSAKRIREHATRFASALKLSADDQLTLERASIVREVGKIRVPNRILLKDSMLTYDDWVLLQQHTNVGADLLQGIDALKDTADVVRRHHCCWDGTGYPDGMEGDQIPLLARCLRILDVYCAMTSPRIYREGRATHKQALEHLREEQGKHFDPELVEVFIKSRVGKT